MPTDENSSIILKAGIEKKSFELYYNGGSIWCEHLDGMGFFRKSEGKIPVRFQAVCKTLYDLVYDNQP